MMAFLKRHPLPVKAYLRRSLVLTYAAPVPQLAPLVSPGLSLDEDDGYGFLAVAMVQSDRLRPAFLRAFCGTSFFLTGYRLFTRYTTPSGKKLRGLQILRSEVDSRLMVGVGNLMTRYNYRLAEANVVATDTELTISIVRQGVTTLNVAARLDRPTLPPGSIFRSEKEARRFAGPMPFTFDYERESNSIVRVQGVREEWNPRLVDVAVSQAPDFGDLGVTGDEPRLVSAFYLENVPYRWLSGVVERLP